MYPRKLNQESTPNLVLFHGIGFLRLCLRAPSLNNVVYVVSVPQALITMARTPPEAVLCRFYRVGFLFHFFFSKPSPPTQMAEEPTEKSGTSPTSYPGPPRLSNVLYRVGFFCVNY